MKWAALKTWIITALGGFGLLAIWLQRGGTRQADQPGRRIRPPLIFTHFLLAAGGLVLWVIYLARRRHEGLGLGGVRRAGRRRQPRVRDARPLAATPPSHR